MFDHSTLKAFWEMLPAALVATTVSAVTSLIIYWWTSESAERRWIGDGITKLIDLSLAYPKLDNKKATAQWPTPEGWSDDDVVRYENYCAYAFNLISRIYKFCHRDTSKMEVIFHFREIIDKHHKWWELEAKNNLEAYGSPFCEWMKNEIEFSKEKEARRAANGNSN